MRRATAISVLAVAVVWALVRWVVYDFPQMGDTRVYQHAARMIRAGFVPYRDFDVEYPPLASGLFLAVDLLPGTFTLAFSLTMAAALAATAAATVAAARIMGLGRGRTAFAVAVVALCPLLLGTLLQTRYDLLVSALLGWTLVAALSGRFGWMWGLLAAATALKLVPVLLVPVLAIWHLRRRGRPAAVRGMVAYAAAVAATFLPFALLAPSGTWELFRYHLVRPLQIESLGASMIQAAGLPFRQVNSFGSENIDGAAPALAAALATLLLLAALVAVAAYTSRATRRGADATVLCTAFAATLLSIVVFGKVLSPQYLVWLLPAVLVLPGRRGAVAAGAVALAMPVTQLVFPLFYGDLVERSAPLPVALLVVRNALLLVALVAVWPRRARAAPRTAPGGQPAVAAPQQAG